jgi:hypothetical protein
MYWRLEFGEVTKFANGRWGATMWINNRKSQIVMVAQDSASKAEESARQHIANKIELHKKCGNYQPMNADRAKYNWRQDTPVMQMVAVNGAICGLLDNFRKDVFGYSSKEEYMDKIKAKVKELSELTKHFMINPEKWTD